MKIEDFRKLEAGDTLNIAEEKNCIGNIWKVLAYPDQPDTIELHKSMATDKEFFYILNDKTGWYIRSKLSGRIYNLSDIYILEKAANEVSRAYINSMISDGKDEFKLFHQPEELDFVNHPNHYGGDTVYEVIKVIRAWGLGFNLGNSVKYIARAGKKDKDKTIEDLEKAIFYINDEIRFLRGGFE